ncbi:Acyl-CoA dehydrogenase [Actinokineospora alba]|uniref:Dibenzothiophene monooxygenase n=1 Tax=Actinokineospora alba TaxID=504798 RepID=A0A1H0HFW6_9PSEU|nr:acyl-CoA dehydrogenase family protein [Actinokineospora alba]TDP64902.1 alkylation response protein AidB-like acyl-CoA dehydrogenase [Actinokineospora alba]SDH48810.1 Acyl-CoA dehydrogenase [Actinokineospora alba]SDO18017.1 Acyl-CoA dehydrogenase [Actinokineospora alba]
MIDYDGLWPDTTPYLAPEVLAGIAADAARADREGRISERGLTLLRESNWPGLAVPEKFGGQGAGLLLCCATQRELAAADPGLAIALNMHLFSIGLMVEHWRRRADVSWLLMEAIATQGRLLASAFAEPDLGGSVSRSTLRARRDGASWVVSGRKAPCSLAGVADLVCLQAQTEEADPRVLVALLPMSAPGLRVERTWDALGMRGSASDTVLLEDCAIPDELVFYQARAGAEDDDVLTAGVVWFALTVTAAYLGVAQAARTAAAELLRRGRISHLGARRADLPSYQAAVGQASADLLALEAGCAGLAARMDAGADPATLIEPALAVKERAAVAVPAAVAALVESCGGMAYGANGALSRLWRDAQAIRFHPPTGPAVRQYLGRRALGVPARLDLDEAAPWLIERTAAERNG